MEKEVKIKEFVKYAGHTVKSSGNLGITFTAMYSELTKSIQVLQLLNNDITLAVKKGDEKPFRLGTFRVKNVIIDGDGESKLKLVSITDSVEMDNLNNIITTDEFQILMQSVIEIEEEENE